MGWVPIFLFSIDVSFPIQKEFYFSILKLMFFVQGCQSYYSHFEIIYYQFCSMVNSSGRKINVFAIAQAEQVFISDSLA